MAILKPDPFMDHYAIQKQVDPDTKIVLKQFYQRQVNAVDRIVFLAKGNRSTVSTENDWKIVEELFSFWATEWPTEYSEFKKVIPQIRATRRSKGYSESGEMKYVGAMPPRFERMLKVIFPDQSFDKTFVNKIVKKIPIFKIGGEQN